MKKLGIGGSLLIYISAALLMYIMTALVIPGLARITGQEIILFWFIVAGTGVFLPLIIAGIVILRKEGYRLSVQTLTQRLRFKRITLRDLMISLGGLILAGILSASVMKIIELTSGKFDHSPPFMAFNPLTQGRYWLLLVWFPYWILNIVGEEFLWRGVMLPRQEVALGKYTWIFHGFGWGLFHIAFGWKLLLTLLPLIFIQSFIVQKTRNTWTGVIMHAGLNGPSFIAICFGLI